MAWVRRRFLLGADLVPRPWKVRRELLAKELEGERSALPD
eukprot:CAMPEP_0198517954 /NCGR_PEP_ID=MMETSP1462-20131121/18842_1 /TAXON_ID=1333877 /ORGANISM="Brandtodinium nutriculum, Strain RCC3387" /LENGTH=39 /DNA_ID= /DNA_START= /DNA_END= /DNA_ORIENTATION=